VLQILKPPLLRGDKVLVRLKLHLDISGLAVELPDSLLVIPRRLLLDLLVMLQLLLQLLILFNARVILVLLGKELPCRSPAGPLTAHEHITL
jgi:hypothetical protein